jgi:ribosomal small subunit protein bTHX
MGKGDKRTKRGKIWRGSYGKSRTSDNKHADTQRDAAKK